MIIALWGLALSIIIQIGKKLGLSKDTSIQASAVIGSLIIASVIYYADVNITFKGYLEIIGVIFASATTIYEIILKKLNPDSLLGKIVGNSR